MSIILAVASLMRGRPSWFAKSNHDWRQLVFASWGLAFSVEIVATVLGLILNDLNLTLRLFTFAPLAYCLVQSFVTDVLYRRADAVALTLGTVAILATTIVTSPLWALVFVALMSVGYLTLRSDGLALVFLAAACFSAAPSVELLGIALIIGAVSTFTTSIIVSKREVNKSLPFVPIVLSSAILSLGFLVGFDIAF